MIGVAGFLLLDGVGISDAGASAAGDGAKGFFRSGLGIREAQNEGVMILGSER
jgi:hypothetical protein